MLTESTLSSVCTVIGEYTNRRAAELKKYNNDEIENRLLIISHIISVLCSNYELDQLKRVLSHIPELQKVRST